METDTDTLPDSESPIRYAENRAILRQVAERMRNETDIDIDELIPLIDRASAAYKACRERVETVDKLLQDRLPPAEDNV